MDLAEFLLARIAEDEAVAREAISAFEVDGGSWVAESFDVYIGSQSIHEGGPVAQADTTANAEHIARWDPARVLAECAAKRRIVEHEAPGPRGTYDGPIRWEYVPPVLALLALPYADHRDYRPEWGLAVSV